MSYAGAGGGYGAPPPPPPVFGNGGGGGGYGQQSQQGGPVIIQHLGDGKVVTYDGVERFYYERPKEVTPPPKYVKGDSPVFGVMAIRKMNKGSGEMLRTVIIKERFLLQLTDDPVPKVKRLLPIDKIATISTNGSYVYITPKDRSHRPWLFRIESKSVPKTPKELAEILSRLRAVLTNGAPEWLHLRQDVNVPNMRSQTGGDSKQSARDVASQLSNKNGYPIKYHGFHTFYPPLPPPEQQPPPQQQQADTTEQTVEDMLFRPLEGPPRRYTVYLDQAGEDCQFNYVVRSPDEGIRVQSIIENGPFHKSGVPCGQLTSLNGRPVQTDEDLAAAFNSAAHLTQFDVELIADDLIAPPPPYKPPPKALPAADPAPARYLPPDIPDADSLDSGSEQDTEEKLAEMLREVAAMRRRGTLSEPDYQEIREKIIAFLNKGRERRGAGNHLRYSPPSSRSGSPHDDHFPAPYPWGEIVGERYIYLREEPARGAGWVQRGAAFGVVRTLQFVKPDWVLAQLDNGARGYVRERYIDYLPNGPPEDGGRGRRGGGGGGSDGDSISTHLAALLKGDEFGSPALFPPASVVSRSSWGGVAPYASRPQSWFDPDKHLRQQPTPQRSSDDLRSDELAWLTL